MKTYVKFMTCRLLTPTTWVLKVLNFVNYAHIVCKSSNPLHLFIYSTF